MHGTFYQRVFALAAAGALALLLFRIFQPFAGAILWSLMLAVLLNQLLRIGRSSPKVTEPLIES